jgi:site-specific DNA-methyltransferase (adenine-specific)
MNNDEHKKYNVVYADPPWSYEKSNSGRGGQSSAIKKYKTMTNQDIMNIPISNMIDKNSVLFLWSTVPLMPEAFAVMNAWGYKYKTMITWRKIMSLGMGYWFRGQTEHLLLGVRGKVKPFYMQVANFYQCKAGRHSEKPHYFRELIMKATDKVFEEPKRVELFARSKHNLFGDDIFQGWDVYGNEVNNSIELQES